MITIPLQIRKRFNLKVGSSLAILEDEGQLVLVPIVNIEELRDTFLPSEKIKHILNDEREK